MKQKTEAPTTRRRNGRPRSETTRLAILAATTKLLETQSVRALTMEAIAASAKVSKATIYRWWRSKASVVIDAFVEHHLVQTPMPRGVTSFQALKRHMQLLIQEYSKLGGRIVAQIIAEGQSDPSILREFRERFHYGRRAVVREVIEQGKRTGEIRSDLDSETIMEVLYSPIYFRLLIGYLPLDDAFARRFPDVVLAMIENQGARKKANGASSRPKRRRSPAPPAGTDTAD